MRPVKCQSARRTGQRIAVGIAALVAVNCSAAERPAGKSALHSSASRGFIRVHPENPYIFAHEDGTPFFGLGDTCYGLVSGISDEQRLRYLDTRAGQGFDFVRFFAAGYPSSRDSASRDAGTAPFSIKTPDAADWVLLVSKVKK
ncbi:MAG: DUF4038 domain-containing protein [Verrucomicrobia bacterium]|nr:DUF4038 domain-containing protein [Verrucomicrobiota bacterium]